MQQISSRLILGWQEWIALPDLCLPALKAKVDTGAKTSALHTHWVEPFGSSKKPMVRFAVRPNPGRVDLEVEAAAPIIERRAVLSSNGERELRFVIATRLMVGEWVWPIELTLTNREKMSYRMLLGRQAIRLRAVVDPKSSFCQPKLSYSFYERG